MDRREATFCQSLNCPRLNESNGLCPTEMDYVTRPGKEKLPAGDFLSNLSNLSIAGLHCILVSSCTCCIAVTATELGGQNLSGCSTHAMQLVILPSPLLPNYLSEQFSCNEKGGRGANNDRRRKGKRLPLGAVSQQSSDPAGDSDDRLRDICSRT